MSTTNWELSELSVNDSSKYNSTSEESIYEVPIWLIVLLSTLYGSVSLLAIIGNFLVIWIISTSRRMQNVTNLYIANLALADVVIAMFAIPFQFQAALLQKWVLPYFMCPFCPFVQALTVNVSVFTLAAVAIDRHKAILFPLSSKPSKKRAKQIICFIWFIGLLLSLPMVFSFIVIQEKHGAHQTIPVCNHTAFGEQIWIAYRTILFIFQYSIPLCMITWAYFRIGMVLWGSEVPGNAQSQRDLTILNNKKKVIKMLLVVVSLFTFCWLPLQLYLLISTYIPDINYFRYINVIFFSFDWFAMSNACYNPFIYGIFNEKFRREFRRRLPFCYLRIKTGAEGFVKRDRDKVIYVGPLDRNDSSTRRKSSFRTIFTTLELDLLKPTAETET